MLVCWSHCSESRCLHTAQFVHSNRSGSTKPNMSAHGFKNTTQKTSTLVNRQNTPNKYERCILLTNNLKYTRDIINEQVLPRKRWYSHWWRLSYVTRICCVHTKLLVLCCVIQLKTTSYIVISILDCNAGRLFVEHRVRSWQGRQLYSTHGFSNKSLLVLHLHTYLIRKRHLKVKMFLRWQLRIEERFVLFQSVSADLCSYYQLVVCSSAAITSFYPNGTRNAETDCTKRNGRIIIWWLLHKD